MHTIIENDLWTNLLGALQKRINRQSFDTWFRPIKFDGCDDSAQTLHLRVPNQVVKDWVSTNYSEVLDASLCEISLEKYHVDWTVDNNETNSSGDFIESEDDAPSHLAPRRRMGHHRACSICHCQKA